MRTSIISQFVLYCDTTLDLSNKLIAKKVTDPNESFYKSLPLCIVDAVFSIGVKYRSVEKAEKTFIEHFELEIPRTYPVDHEYTIHDFIIHMDSFQSFEKAATLGFDNRQRTSSRNGILKAEACYRVAMVFKNRGINTLEDFRTYPTKSKLDADILKVKGQSSGIMLKYLYMLAGNANEVKPDRHMVRFMQQVFPHLTMATKDHSEIKQIMTETVSMLKSKYPQLTERFLDYLIWEYMSQKKPTRKKQGGVIHANIP